ncbi:MULTISPECIES: putative entry exclusion protein TrbK-alt [Xanthobacteraceae]|uniref:Conjugative transfer region protein TrbK n=1 Tax=Labrys monachus TaxID=217067 RepID=A0ABU0FFS9_9HYPH|nr:MULTISPECIES: putative entry exclusion protein TrbK-alt [Xanthobacteraceae]MBS7538440.1 putative entry exclusion protein TrbK-alt [Ancylobacter lacus]MDQ0393461.1 conjugative transfer region protein TrbK [Labrys monachus]
MDGKMLARIAAVVFVGTAVTATVIELTRKDAPPAYHGPGLAATTPSDPLRTELRRCQRIGEAGRSDPACLNAWAESRLRFLGQAANETPAPGAPSAPNVGATKEPTTEPSDGPNTVEAR